MISSIRISHFDTSPRTEHFSHLIYNGGKDNRHKHLTISPSRLRYNVAFFMQKFYPKPEQMLFHVLTLASASHLIIMRKKWNISWMLVGKIKITIEESIVTSYKWLLSHWVGKQKMQLVVCLFSTQWDKNNAFWFVHFLMWLHTLHCPKKIG